MNSQRYSYDIDDIIGPASGEGIDGFRLAPQQPYASGRGLRFGVPRVRAGNNKGFTEVVHITDGLHAVIMDWPADPEQHVEGVWSEHLANRYGWLYVGIEGDGSVEVEGFGKARRSGATCSLTLTPPESTYIWRLGPTSMRRGISIAFHANYLRNRYPDLLQACPNSMGAWLAGKETILRDFDLPYLPVMNYAAASLLDLVVGGEFRYQFACATVEQLLTLAMAELVKQEMDRDQPARLSHRDKAVIRKVRDALIEDLTDPPTIDELVQRFGINRNKLRFGFKEVFGVTISEYLQSHRMDCAHNLLRSGECTVSEVASRVGYGHASNFTTAFKGKFGHTPGQVAASSVR